MGKKNRIEVFRHAQRQADITFHERLGALANEGVNNEILNKIRKSYIHATERFYHVANRLEAKNAVIQELRQQITPMPELETGHRPEFDGEKMVWRDLHIENFDEDFRDSDTDQYEFDYYNESGEGFNYEADFNNDEEWETLYNEDDEPICRMKKQ